MNLKKYIKPVLSRKKIKKNFFLTRGKSRGDSFDELLGSNLLAYPGCGHSCNAY